MWEMRAVLFFAEDDHKWLDCKISEKELREQVIDLAFYAEPQVAEKVKEFYTNPAPDAGSDDDGEMDAETMELITELMLQDECNGQDLKNFKEDLDRKSARRLVQKKRQYQRDEAAKRKQKLNRKKELQQAKKKINPKLKKHLRRKKPSASAPGDGPAPGGPAPGPSSPPAAFMGGGPSGGREAEREGLCEWEVGGEMVGWFPARFRAPASEFLKFQCREEPDSRALKDSKLTLT